MRKTLLIMSVWLAIVGCAVAYASSQHHAPMSNVADIQSATPYESSPSYGVSIGTVEAKLKSESGIESDYFMYSDYIAQVSDGTYLGFGYYNYESDVQVNGIYSTDENVTIPDSITIDGNTYPVHIISIYDYTDGLTSKTKTLTIPSTIEHISFPWKENDHNLEAIYMLGSKPYLNGVINIPKLFVCDKDYFDTYFEDYGISYETTVLPYGWDYEWSTVNVEKNGEFTDIYLTQNGHDWEAAQYLKITGNLNEYDLNNIKNITTLKKLDLSETKITSLPNNFLRESHYLNEVILPSSIEVIGDYAFSQCEHLKDINLKDVKTISYSAFYDCERLNNIDLSDAINIGSMAFNQCYSLSAADLSSAIKIEHNAFYYCSSLKNIILGDNTVSIGSQCFGRTAIESIKLPASLLTLESYVFEYCSKLSKVELPHGLTTIGYSAFYECTSLEEISVPSTVTKIGGYAFTNTGIKTFNCHATVPPVADNSFVGGNMDMKDIVLYVPPFSKDTYRNTENWNDFYVMRSLKDQIEYMYIDRPITINLEEEDNDVLVNNPEIVLSTQQNDRFVGQLTASGEGTLSAGKMTINTVVSRRNYYYGQYCPTLINYADKMRADSITINMTLYGERRNGCWRFISLPYDVKVSEIIPSEETYWVIRRYDSAARAGGETSETWVDLKKDDVMEAGKGYIISAMGGETYIDEYGNTRESDPRFTFNSGNSLTKNNIFRSTDAVVPLTEYVAEFAHNRSWNLIGNPYPCYFDIHFLNKDFTAPVTVWDGNAYVAYSPVDDDLVLSPYEAFFVQCPTDATEMTFKEGGRLHFDEGKTRYKSPALNGTSISAEGRNVFNFNIANENFCDRTRIVLNPESSMDYEIGRDASKFFAESNTEVQIYVADGVNYSITERPVNDGMATVGIRSAKDGVYTLSLSGSYNAEWHVILTDNLTGITTDLSNEDYQFTTTAGESGDRFTVSFRLGEQSGIDSVVADFGEEANVTVTATNGVTVYTGSLLEINVPAPGLYIISNGQETRKAILK